MEQIITAGRPRDARRLLGVYLRDRLAAGVVEVALAERSLRSNHSPTWEGPLSRVLDEARADQRDLEAAAGALGIRPARFKEAAARAAEKLGRLKLNGRWRTYSPLSRVQEIEGLMALATVRAAAFAALDGLHEPRLASQHVSEAGRRAQERIGLLRDLSSRATAEALG